MLLPGGHPTSLQELQVFITEGNDPNFDTYVLQFPGALGSNCIRLIKIWKSIENENH